MNLVLWLAVIVTVSLSVAFLAVVRRLRRPPEPLPEGDWLARISAVRYRPMERLLDPGEEAFLAQHADRAAVRRYRVRRRKIFRGYLKSLERDFGRICRAIQLVLVHSGTDRPELVSVLMKQQATFAFAIFAVRVRLWLHAAGLGTVDVRELVGSLETMREELGRLAATPAGVAA